jgi:hypothetical protein
MRKAIFLALLAVGMMMPVTPVVASADQTAPSERQVRMRGDGAILSPSGEVQGLGGIALDVKTIMAATYGHCTGPDTQWASSSGSYTYTAKTKSCLAWEAGGIWGRHTITCFRSGLAYPCNTINRDTVNIATFYWDGSQWQLLRQRNDWDTDVYNVQTYTFVGYCASRRLSTHYITTAANLNVAFANGVVGTPKNHESGTDHFGGSLAGCP